LNLAFLVIHPEISAFEVQKSLKTLQAAQPRLVNSVRQPAPKLAAGKQLPVRGVHFVLSSDQRAPQYSGQLLSPVLRADNPPEQARQTGHFLHPLVGWK
jgi:hypothetical protein